jgi:hypothetical protein
MSADRDNLDDLFEMSRAMSLILAARTSSKFFAEELNIDIYDARYGRDGDSKGERLRCILQAVDTPAVVRPFAPVRGLFPR